MCVCVLVVGLKMNIFEDKSWSSFHEGGLSIETYIFLCLCGEDSKALFNDILCGEGLVAVCWFYTLTIFFKDAFFKNDLDSLNLLQNVSNCKINYLTKIVKKNQNKIT